MTYRDENFAMSGNWGAIHSNGPECLEGHVMTLYGIVQVFSAEADAANKRGAQTIATMTHDGRCYRRIWPRAFSKRGLSVVAGKFSRDVVEGWVS